MPPKINCPRKRRSTLVRTTSTQQTTTLTTATKSNCRNHVRIGRVGGSLGNGGRHLFRIGIISAGGVENAHAGRNEGRAAEIVATARRKRRRQQ